MAHLEKFVEKTIQSTDARFVLNENKISELSQKIDKNSSALYPHVDQKIQSITAEFPDMLILPMLIEEEP